MSQPSYHLSQITEQTLAAAPIFASVTARTTFRDLKAAIDSAMTELTAAATKGTVQFNGPPVFIYRGAERDPDKAFTLEIGFPAAAGAKPTGQVQIRSLAALKTAALSFEGPISAIDKAYDELLPQVRTRKLRPTGEVREVYNSWEGGDSRKNQILIGVGVE